MGTTDKTAAIRQKRMRERRAKELTECRTLKAAIDELTENLEITDAQRWQQLNELIQTKERKP